jgi:hypothetical protein
MSSELERRLEGLFSEAPEPEAGAGEEALHRALQALHPVAPARRGLRTAVLVFAAAAVLLGIAAGSLAAAGALHVSFGHKAKPRPATTQLVLPRGAEGIAAIVDGRLSVVTTGGFRLQGLPVTSAALSPHALFVAAGIGRSLVALKPSGRQAWSQPARGTVVAIAWAPFGNRIAYVVHIGHRFALHVIWGNGTHDTTIDRRVRAIRPSWRSDSLAFAYVGAGGKAIVYDVGHRSRSILAVRPPVTGVAFAPTGDSVAVEQDDGVWVLHQSAAEKIPGHVDAFGWLSGRLADVVPGQGFVLVRLYASTGASRGSFRAQGDAVTVTPTVVVVRKGRSLVAGHTTLLTVPRGSTVQMLEIG